MSSETTYIHDQLQRLLTHNSPDTMQIKITGDVAESKVLNLTPSNIGEIISFLKLLSHAQTEEILMSECKHFRTGGDRVKGGFNKVCLSCGFTWFEKDKPLTEAQTEDKKRFEHNEMLGAK